MRGTLRRRRAKHAPLDLYPCMTSCHAARIAFEPLPPCMHHGPLQDAEDEAAEEEAKSPKAKKDKEHKSEVLLLATAQ